MKTKESFLVQQWVTPHWSDVQSFKSREAAIRFASEIGGKSRVLEFPGGREIATFL